MLLKCFDVNLKPLSHHSPPATNNHISLLWVYNLSFFGTPRRTYRSSSPTVASSPRATKRLQLATVFSLFEAGSVGFICRVLNFRSAKSAFMDGTLTIYLYMVVSWNGCTPKSSILVGFSLMNHPFWGTRIYGNPHMTNKKNTLLLRYMKQKLYSLI